jgi:uncharacterized protein YjaZ
MGKNRIDYATKKKYAILTIKWCKENFGINEKKRTKLKFELTDKKRTIKDFPVYGNYCFWRNKITLHEPTCITIKDVVSTVIHEYTHYLQSRPKYLEYQKKYFYSTNPYEREAKRNEEKYTKICMNEIKKLIK